MVTVSNGTPPTILFQEGIRASRTCAARTVRQRHAAALHGGARHRQRELHSDRVQSGGDVADGGIWRFAASSAERFGLSELLGQVQRELGRIAEALPPARVPFPDNARRRLVGPVVQLPDHLHRAERRHPADGDPGRAERRSDEDWREPDGRDRVSRRRRLQRIERRLPRQLLLERHGYVNEKKWKAAAQYFTDSPGAFYKNDWHFVEAYVKMNSIARAKASTMAWCSIGSTAS